MPVVFMNGTPTAVSMAAPAKELGGGGAGSSRPSEGKMFPRGTGK